MSVGGFPGLINARKQAVRAPINPMDKCTVISIYPHLIREIKPTIQPGLFVIQPGTPENPSLLVVGSSSWWKELDDEQPLLEIPNSSIQVASSIVNDYCNGLLACNMQDAVPGIFYVPGEWNITEVRAKFANLLAEAKVKQDNWYRALIKLGDGLWAKTGGNPLVISDQMRDAAKSLGVEGKDWMRDFAMAQTVQCPACGSPRNPNFPVCANCKAITDPEKAKALGIVFAKS